MDVQLYFAYLQDELVRNQILSTHLATVIRFVSRSEDHAATSSFPNQEYPSPIDALVQARRAQRTRASCGRSLRLCDRAQKAQTVKSQCRRGRRATRRVVHSVQLQGTQAV